ncbi:MAG: histidinol-phosphatase HisJ family protein [Ruminococcaceae bacterium]|jgi:histidinol-phosphatase (PHP family)|nr:histidinol-phosphatase HisJ family protein [Oscillospiraceae bacterium]
MKNFHTHTVRCGHAKGKDEKYVEKAIKNGFSTLGFSDHSPMVFAPENHRSTFRVPLEKAEDYVTSINSLKEKYKGEIKIHLGYEMEYYPKYFNQTLNYLEQFGFEYLILGQHFVSNECDEDAVYSGNATESVYDFERYINQALEGLNTGRFLYIAHPDLFKFKGSDEIYYEKMEYFAKEIHLLGYPVEFNLLGFADKRNYPDPRFWEIVAKEGNDVVIGFDAHEPSVLSDMKTFEKAKAYLNSLGIEPMNDKIEIE